MGDQFVAVLEDGLQFFEQISDLKNEKIHRKGSFNVLELKNEAEISKVKYATGEEEIWEGTSVVSVGIW